MKTRSGRGAERWSGAGATSLGVRGTLQGRDPPGGLPRAEGGLLPAAGSRAAPGLPPLQLQESCEEAMAAPAPPGTRHRSTRRHGASLPRPIPTHAQRLDTEATGPRFPDKMSLLQNIAAPQTGWSVPGRTMEHFSSQPQCPVPRGSSPEAMMMGRGAVRASGLWREREAPRRLRPRVGH